MLIHQDMKRYITFLSFFIFLIFSTTALSDDGGYGSSARPAKRSSADALPAESRAIRTPARNVDLQVREVRKWVK